MSSSKARGMLRAWDVAGVCGDRVLFERASGSRLARVLRCCLQHLSLMAQSCMHMLRWLRMPTRPLAVSFIACVFARGTYGRTTPAEAMAAETMKLRLDTSSLAAACTNRPMPCQSHATSMHRLSLGTEIACARATTCACTIPWNVSQRKLSIRVRCGSQTGMRMRDDGATKHGMP